MIFLRKDGIRCRSVQIRITRDAYDAVGALQLSITKREISVQPNVGIRLQITTLYRQWDQESDITFTANVLDEDAFQETVQKYSNYVIVKERKPRKRNRG